MLSNEQVFTPKNIRHMEDIIARAIKDPWLQEDVRQDALLLAWLDLKRFRGESDVRTWLHTIARNQAAMAQRSLLSRMKYIRIQDDVFFSRVWSDEPSPEELAANREELAQCLTDVREMDEIFQRTFDAFFVREEPREEIATREGIPTGTIGRRISDVRDLVCMLRNARLEPRTRLSFG